MHIHTSVSPCLSVCLEKKTERKNPVIFSALVSHPGRRHLSWNDSDLVFPFLFFFSFFLSFFRSRVRSVISDCARAISFLLFPLNEIRILSPSPDFPNRTRRMRWIYLKGGPDFLRALSLCGRSSSLKCHFLSLSSASVKKCPLSVFSSPFSFLSSWGSKTEDLKEARMQERRWQNRGRRRYKTEKKGGDRGMPIFAPFLPFSLTEVFFGPHSRRWPGSENRKQGAPKSKTEISH